MVLYFVFTIIFTVSTLIVLTCLKNELKKFNKRLARADSKETDLVTDIKQLDRMMARYAYVP